MTTVYRAILAPGIGAGMKLDEIQKITTMGANAVKALLPGSGKTQMQLVQEVRDLVQGGITPGASTLASSLTITDADLAKAKASTEGLFKFLNDKLSGFDDVSKAFPDTLQGKMDNLEETATLASAAITEAFGVMKNVEEKASSRVASAKIILEMSFKAIELKDLQERVDELEKLITERLEDRESC